MFPCGLLGKRGGRPRRPRAAERALLEEWGAGLGMKTNARKRKVALGVAIPALAIFAFGAVSFIDAVLSPWACGIVCASPPWRSLDLSLEILGVGGALFTLSVLVGPNIFDGQRALVGSGLLCLVLGGITLEGNAASLFADFYTSLWGGSLYYLFAILMILTFGILSFSLLAVGARHWWIAGEQTRGFLVASIPGGKSTILEGVVLLLLGIAGAILDVLFAGCEASGPCQPNPLVPLLFPLLVFAVGAGLVMAVVWKPNAKTT